MYQVGKFAKVTNTIPAFLMLLFLNIGSGEFAAGSCFLIIVASLLGKCRENEKQRKEFKHGYACS